MGPGVQIIEKMNSAPSKTPINKVSEFWHILLLRGAQFINFSGCGCQYTHFGCCSDGKTAALDESRKCSCNATKYGCCPDGIGEAQDENLSGCVDIGKAGGMCCCTIHTISIISTHFSPKVQL